MRPLAQIGRVIRNVVLHPLGDQPMLADLVVRPQPSDVNLLLTNLRTIDGKRPPALEYPDGVLLWPLATIRFLEVPASELAATDIGQPAAGGAWPAADDAWPEPDTTSQPGERPSAAADVEGNGHEAVPLRLPSPGADLAPGEPEPDLDDDASEELLRRIREL
jgi:hypothetical protein